MFLALLVAPFGYRNFFSLALAAMVASGILLVYGNYFLGNYFLICLDKRGWSSAPFSMRIPFGGGCIVKKFFFFF